MLLFKKTLTTLILSLFIAFIGLIVLSSKPPSAFAQVVDTCEYVGTYTDGSPITNFEIVANKSFQVQVKFHSAGQYQLHYFVSNSNGGFEKYTTAGNGIIGTITLTSTEIFSGQPQPQVGDWLKIQPVFLNTDASACASYGSFTNEANYDFVQTASTCVGTLSLAGTTLTGTATGCNGKIVIIKLSALTQKTIFNQTMTSDSWTQDFDISADINNYDSALMYICDTANPNCQNLVAQTTLGTVFSCPIFAGFDPDPPQADVEFKAQYHAQAGKSPFDYVVIVTHDNQETRPPITVNGNLWVATVGTYPVNSQVKLELFPASSVYDLTKRCDSQLITLSPLLVPGENPCKNGFCVTGLGVIPTTVGGFGTAILDIALGLAGGIVLILMVLGAIQILASSGDPKKSAAGRERIIAALAGLLFLIFAVLILNFIGVNILGGVPGIQ